MSLNLILGVLRILYALVNLFEAMRDAKAEKTVETERGKAAALDDDELQKEADTWTRKS